MMLAERGTVGAPSDGQPDVEGAFKSGGHARHMLGCRWRSDDGCFHLHWLVPVGHEGFAVSRDIPALEADGWRIMAS